MHGVQDDEGKPTDWGHVEPELLYGSHGWCEADEPLHRCHCFIDGLAGSTCEETTGSYPTVKIEFSCQGWHHHSQTEASRGQLIC